MRKLSTVIAGALALCATEASAVGIVGPDEVVEGKTIGEWAGEWWNWVLGQPAGDNAFGVGGGGENPAANQSGPVWFLAGTFGGEATRFITVPKDKYVLAPAINVVAIQELDFPDVPDDEVADDLTDLVEGIVDGYTGIVFEINGVSVTDIPGSPIGDIVEDTRHISPPFAVEIAPDNLFGAPADWDGPGVAGGHWLMLEPRGGESYTLRFAGVNPADDFRAEVFVTVPAPATLSLLGLGLAGLAFAGRRKKTA